MPDVSFDATSGRLEYVVELIQQRGEPRVSIYGIHINCLKRVDPRIRIEHVL